MAKANAQVANLKRKELAEDPIEPYENTPGLASAASTAPTHEVAPAVPAVSEESVVAAPVMKQLRTQVAKSSVSAPVVHVEEARTAEAPKQTWADIEERMGVEARDVSLAKKKALNERHDVMWGQQSTASSGALAQRTKVQQNEREAKDPEKRDESRLRENNR